MEKDLFSYKLKKVDLRRWWKDGRIWYEAELEKVLGAKEPQMVTKRMRNAPLNPRDNVNVQVCGKKHFKGYEDQNGLFANKQVGKTYDSGEIDIVCEGFYVTVKTWNWLNNGRCGRELEEAKYVISYEKIVNGEIIEIVCIPYGIGGITSSSLVPPDWCRSNDGKRKRGKDASNFFFLFFNLFC